MKKRLILLPLIVLSSCSQSESYVLTDKTFFMVMNNIQYYPEEYIGKSITLDCFTYELVDVEGESHICGVRKCTAGYGCKCGKDTIIGFLLNYDGEIPAPRNQYEDTNDKTWINIKGEITSVEKEEFSIFSDTGESEKVQFLNFDIKELEIIEDASDLRYFVDN